MREPGVPVDQAAEAQRVLVAITGASGAVYGLRLLQALGSVPGIETHLVVSDAGWLTLRHELDPRVLKIESCSGVARFSSASACARNIRL